MFLDNSNLSSVFNSLLIREKESFDSSLNMGDHVANMSIDNGLICRPLGPAIVLCPQFIITKAQIDEMFVSLHQTVKKTFN